MFTLFGFSIPSMVQNSDKVQLGTPASKPPNSARPQTPPKAPWVEEMKPDDREAKYSARKVRYWKQFKMCIFVWY